MKRIFLLLIVQTLVLSALAQGWHITTRYFSQPQRVEQERTEELYLHKGYMKMVNGNLTTVFNLINNEIIYINSQNRSFWRGNPERFVKEVRAELEASIEEKLVGVEPQKQEEMRAMYMEMIDASFPTESQVSANPKLFAVRKEKDGEKVSTFTATRYVATEQGLLLETLWVAPELTVAKDFDFISLSHFLNQLAQGAYADSFESSPEYFKLLERGYPVRVEIRRGDGSTQVSEVVSAMRISPKSTDFSVPAGYSASSLAQVGVWDGYI